LSGNDNEAQVIMLRTIFFLNAKIVCNIAVFLCLMSLETIV